MAGSTTGSLAERSKTRPTEQDPRWAAVRARDRSADGTFYYSVRTTGVYCRPSCPARLANPANVRFHLTCTEAERAGWRACLRCKPDQPTHEQHAATVTRACRLLEQADEMPSLADLAAAAGLSRFHFHRVFKALIGMTPRRYAAARRAQRVRSALAASGTVTEAIYGAGFNSSSRFYETADGMLGMSTRAFRAGGADMQVRFAVGECSLGAILVARSVKGVCAVLLGDDPDALVRDLQDRFARAELIGGDAEFEALVAQVVGLIEAPRLGHDLPLDVRGTAFQQRVWQALRDIPAGATASYSEIAGRIGQPKAVRAVAAACAANPIAVAIPCHRVVRTDGALSGYRWGAERKRALLAREKGST